MPTPSIQDAFTHFAANRLEETEAACQTILQANPNHADAWRLFGLLASRIGRHDVAIQALGKAISLRPGIPEYHYDLANALRTAGQFDPAIAAYREALQLRPRYSDALINLGIALASTRRRDEAAEAWRTALELDPQDIDALANLGNLYRLIGRHGDAINFCGRALALNPTDPKIITNLGIAYEQQGRLDEAIAMYRRARQLQPKSPYIHSNLLMDLTYHGAIPPAEVFAEYRRWNEEHAKPLATTIMPHLNDRSPDRKLRIGYVSADFRNHAIEFFIEPILAHHDPAQIEVFCYSAVPYPDAVTARLKNHGHTWRSIVGVRDPQVAEMIQTDKIDILVDMAVHTSGRNAGHHLLLFARKPAPVQATYLGYASTTGLDAIDWRITDAIVDPPGLTESLHSEKLMRLPRTHWCYQPSVDAPDVAPPAFDRNGFITFGNAPNLAKVTPQVIELWSKTLHATAGSRFILKSRSLADESTRRLMKDAFAIHDIGEDRLSFEPGGSMENYFEFFSRIDICLDTFPFAGGTTTCHTLWMGVPVITLVGAVSVSRVGASVLTNIGLADLIAESPEQFVQIAIDLAGNTTRLRDIRRNLRAMMKSSPVCDQKPFVRDLEAAYRAMWKAFCAVES